MYVFWSTALVAAVCIAAPISRPVVRDADIANAVPDYLASRKHNKSNAYLASEPLARDVSALHVSPSQCGYVFEPLWSVEVGASVYSTPVVFPMHNDGAKEILLSTFSSFVEIIEHDGYKPFGWPISFENSEFHASPVLHDVNGDQNTDVCVADTDGHIFWVQLGDYSKYLRDYSIVVPKLTVQKDWYTGLTGDFIEAYVQMSMFSHEKAGSEGTISAEESTVKKASQADSLSASDRLSGPRRKVLQFDLRESEAGDPHVENAKHDHQGGLPVDDLIPYEMGHAGQGAFANEYRYAAFPAADDIFFYRDPYRHFDNESNRIDIDAHILTTPAIADVNDDGHIELVVAISYYFDTEKYSSISDIDPTKYVAGGLGAWDLESKDWAWLVHLDLTTSDTSYMAYMYSSPVVVDIDGDGRQEVVVGTAMGLVYVLDANTGFVKRHFPQQVAPLRAQISVSDVVGDSDLELIIADMKGNLVVMGTQGDVFWDYKLTGAVHHAPTIGDIDGDGMLDIVCTCITPDGESHVWAFNGQTGDVLQHFPLQTHHSAAVVSSVLLTSFHIPATGAVRERLSATHPALKLGGAQDSRGLHLVVPAFDGHVYVIDGATGCTNRIDVGEHIYSMVLADDVDGDGSLDLVLGTMNGQVMLFDTNTPYNPKYSWASMPRHRQNGFTVGQQGIFFSPENEMYGGLRYVRHGPEVSITFEIFDKRIQFSKRKYDVCVSKGTSRRSMLFRRTYQEPGIYTVTLILPRPERVKLVISMTNEHAQYFEDTMTLSVNEYFHNYIKFLILIPVCICVIPILLLSEKGRNLGLLPS